MREVFIVQQERQCVGASARVVAAEGRQNEWER